MQKTIKNFFESEIVIETVPWICLGYYILYHLILCIYATSEGIDTFAVDILSGISVVVSSTAYKNKNKNKAIAMLCVTISALTFLSIVTVIFKVIGQNGFLSLLRSLLLAGVKIATFISFIQLSLNVPRRLNMIKTNQICIVILIIVDLFWSVYVHTVKDFPIYHTIPREIATIAEYVSIVALEFKLGLYNCK